MSARPFCSSLACALLIACSSPPSRVVDGGPGLGDGGLPEFCEPVRGEPDLALEPIAGGLRNPVTLTAPDGDRRLFVTEQHTGQIRIIGPDGAVRDDPFLDIGDEIGKAVEQGLLGLAFHPDYPETGRFFISFTEAGSDRVEVEAWRVSRDDPNRADPAERQTVLSVEQNRRYHNGGGLRFGPDGYLHVSLGDSGPWGDGGGNAQNLGTLRGSILRIDVDAGGDERPYGIPDDNPFVDEPDARGEILAYGLRNPWSFSVDPVTGHVFIGDVGGDFYEELDIIPFGSGGGLNFGWPVYEGSSCRSEDPCEDGFDPPTYEYEHGDDACAILVGPAYRGCRMPGHHGEVFFTDLCSGSLRTLTYAANPAPPLAKVREWPDLDYPDSGIGGIGRGGFGEIYVMSIETGDILRVVPD